MGERESRNGADAMNAIKQLASKQGVLQSASRSLTRSFHSTKPAFGGDHAPDYVHAPKMYTIKKMPNRKLKFGAMIGGAAVLGFGIPFWAVKFTQSKTGA